MELRCGDRLFELGVRTYVMAIVNVTPDSFSDGGRFDRPDEAYAQAMLLLEQGADVIDLGAESSRPGAIPIDAEQEWARLAPVLRLLAAANVRCTSIDTTKPVVAERALELGAAWINDVSGLADDRLAPSAASADALIVMHQRAMRAGAAEDPVAYRDVVGEVGAHLARLIERAVAGGVRRDRVVIDPGIGFGKSAADNVALLDRIDELAAIVGPGSAILVGPSRKRFLGVLSGATEIEERDAATVGACCLAALRGADLVRVHTVSEVRHALAIVDACRPLRRADTAQ